MAAFTDDQLERQLSMRMRAETAGLEPPPGLAATVRRRHSRWMWSVRIAGALPVVAVITVAALVALMSAPGGSAGDPTGAGPASPKLLNASSVTERTTAALADLTEYVQRTHEVASDGLVTDCWSDGATGRKRIDDHGTNGKPLSSATIAKSGAATVVNHTERHWYKDTILELVPAKGSKPSPIDASSLVDPMELKKALAGGTLKLVGEGRLNGRDAIQLRWTVIEGLTADIWVDATSYLPLRKVKKGLKLTTTIDYRWLPRTGKNLAELDLTVPAGYRKLASPPDPRD